LRQPVERSQTDRARTGIMTRPSLAAPRFSVPTGGLRQLLTVAMLISLAACEFDEVDGDGDRSDETRRTSSFARIQNDADLDVEIIQGAEPAVVVSIDENLQDLVRTRVVGDVLHIETREDIGDVVSGPHVLVTVPELLAIKLDGSGSMRAELDQSDKPFDLFLDGSGVMSFRGHAAVIGAYLSGSGDIQLEGETSDIDIDLSGSGSVRAKALRAESGSIDLSGSGDVSATIESSVTVSLSGSGDIDLYGDATLDGYEHSGSGDIVEH
jgi:hypothetical protein